MLLRGSCAFSKKECTGAEESRTFDARGILELETFDLDSKLNELRQFVTLCPPGPIQDTRTLSQLLAACWDDLEGGRVHGMNAGKLRRLEKAQWKPPTLEFLIERHGGTMMGSTRAELQLWEIHIEAIS